MFRQEDTRATATTRTFSASSRSCCGSRRSRPVHLMAAVTVAAVAASAIRCTSAFHVGVGRTAVSPCSSGKVRQLARAAAISTTGTCSRSIWISPHHGTRSKPCLRVSTEDQSSSPLSEASKDGKPVGAEQTEEQKQQQQQQQQQQQIWQSSDSDRSRNRSRSRSRSSHRN